MNLCTLHPEVTSDEVVRVIVEKFYELHDETEVRKEGLVGVSHQSPLIDDVAHLINCANLNVQ